MSRVSDTEWTLVFDWLNELVRKFNSGKFGNYGSRVDEIVLPGPLYDELLKSAGNSGTVPGRRIRPVGPTDSQYVRHGGLLWDTPTVELSNGGKTMTVTILNEARAGSGEHRDTVTTDVTDPTVLSIIRRTAGLLRLLENERK